MTAEMNQNWRKLVAFVLCAAAVATAIYFIDYRVVPEQIVPGTRDVTWGGPKEVLWLGDVAIAPPPGSAEERFHAVIGGERGLFAKHGYAPATAALWGLGAPTLMIFVAVLLSRGERKRT